MISNQTSFFSMKEQNIRQSYDGFHSERHETTHDIDNTGSHQITFNNFDHFGLQFHIKYPVQTLISHFKLIFNQKGFKVTETFPGKIMITRLRIKDRIKQIFSSKEPPRYLLAIQTQEYKSMRKVLIKPLFQKMHSHPEIKQFYEWIEQPPVLQIKQATFQEDEFESEYQQDMYSLQATSTYMFHKIFVDKNYSIGKKMQKFIEQNPSLKSENVVGGLNEITDDMLQSFNCTRKELLAILCYCRKSVEDYYHDRMYKHQSREEFDLKNSSIETQASERAPLTTKCFYRLCEEENSVSIMKDLFLLNYTFTLESEINGLSETEKKGLGKKLGQIFSKDLKKKIGVLEMWKYSHPFYEELILPFI